MASQPHPPDSPSQGFQGRQDTSHGACATPSVGIDSYSLALEDSQGLVGDQASETAFRQVLKDWRQALDRAGPEPFGTQDAEALGLDELKRIADDDSGHAASTRALALAVNEFSARLAYVIGRFMRHPRWAGVERIVIGGGFKESPVGRLAMRRTQQRLADEGLAVELRALRHQADDGGLAGWCQLHPGAVPQRAFLAVDIGGTNVCCGIVEPVQPGAGGGGASRLCDARVAHREKWRHADTEPPQDDLVEGIVGMLRRLIGHAQAHGIELLPFIGVGCPGVIQGDGSISRGAQNLPGDWERASFHLPRRIAENLPSIGGADTLVLMHNDAVVQGLSELPFTRDVRRWAVLTIGTGLGNASFTNLDEGRSPAAETAA